MNPDEHVRAATVPAAPGIRRGLLVAVAAYLLLGAGLLTSLPPWEAPDETWHAAYAEALARGSLPTLEQTYEAHHPPVYYLWPAGWLRVLGRSSLPLAEHNPHYPFATSVFLHPPDEPLAAPLRLLRFLSSLLALPAIALVGVTAARVARRRQDGAHAGQSAFVASMAMLLFALWPQWLFISNTLNNDTAAVLVGALLSAGLVRVALPRRDRRGTAGLLGCAAALAVGVKLNVAVLLPVVGLGIVIAGRSQLRPRRASSVEPDDPAAQNRWWQRHASGFDGGSMLAIVAGAIVAIAILGIGAPESLAHFRSLLSARTGGGGLGLPANLPSQLALLAESSWGRLGWMNVALPWPSLAIGALVVLGGLAGLLRRWADDLGYAVGRVASPALVRGIAYSRHTKHGSRPSAAGKASFPSLPAAVVLLALGWSSWLASAGSRPRRAWLSALGLFLLLAVDVHIVGRLLPQSYATARSPQSSGVYERMLPAQWLPVAVLGRKGDGLSQGLRVTSNELAEIALPVHLAQGSVEVELRLRDDAGAVIAEHRSRLTAGPEHHWLRLGLPEAGETSAPQRGQAAVLEVVLLASDGGDLVMWGGEEDHYALGALGELGDPALLPSPRDSVDGGGRGAQRDLVMLWLHRSQPNP